MDDLSVYVLLEHMDVIEGIPCLGPPFMSLALADSGRPCVTCTAIDLNRRCVILHFPVVAAEEEMFVWSRLPK